MEDGDDGGRRGSAPSIWPDGATLAAMDDVLEKLKLLDYETTFCRTKSYPPFDHYIFAMAGRVSPFPVFASLTSWALKLAKVDFVDWEFDDPSTASNNMLVELSKLGFSADFPAAKLKTGFGIQVLTLLKFVLDRALRVNAVRLRKPTYDMSEDPVQTQDEGAIEIDDDFNADGAEDNDDPGMDDAEDNGEEVDYNELYAAEQQKDGNDDQEAAPTVLESTVDPAEWKLELERVAPLLKMGKNAGAKEWRTHLDSMVKHESVLRETFPDAEVQLGKIGAQVGEIASRIASQERHIQEKFAHLGTEFKENQAQLETATSEYTRLSGIVSILSEKLASSSEEVDTLKRQLDSRSDSMTDTSPLRRIRGALLELRAEIKRMDLYIGVLRHTLLASRMRSTKKPISVFAQETRINKNALSAQ